MKRTLVLVMTIALISLLVSCATKAEAPKSKIEKEITIIENENISSPEEAIILTEAQPEKEEEEAPIEAVIIEEEKEELKEAFSPSLTEEKEEIIAETPSEIAPSSFEETGENYFKEVDLSDLSSAFNYAYGLKTMDSILLEGISLDAHYFAKGVYDAVSSAIPLLISSQEIDSSISKYVNEFYYEGKTFPSGTRPVGPQSLEALPLPITTEERFSYAYTFSIIRDLVDGEVDVRAEEFVQGALDSLFQEEALMTREEADNVINRYIDYLNREYQNELEGRKESNKERAEAFLSRNSQRPEISVLEDKIQYEILDEDETLGEHPAQFDTVIADYNMYVMDYETESLDIIDADYWAELRLLEVNSALRSSIVALRVGQAGRFWIPPEMMYGDRNIEGIEPYSIIAYDIALHSIL